MKNKLIKKYQNGGNYYVTYTDLDKLKKYDWYDGTKPHSYKPPIVLPVFNEEFTPEQYMQEAKQFVKEHPGDRLTYLNPIVIKPLDGKIFDSASFTGDKRVNKLIDSQGRVIFENKTGQRLQDLLEIDYKGGKGYITWDPQTNKKKLVAYQLPNDQYPRELPEGYDVNSLENEWDLQYDTKYKSWKGYQSDKPKVTIESFRGSNSPIGPPIAKLFAGLMTLPIAQATGIGEKLIGAMAPRVTKGVNYFTRTPSSRTLYGPGYGTAAKSIGRNLLEQTLASTGGFEAVNLLSESITGKSWGDAVRSILPDGPKWMPEWGKQILADATNVGGWASPNMFYNMYGTLSNKFNQIGNKLVKDVPWIRNQFIAKQIYDNIANTNLQIPNTINFGKRYITVKPYNSNIYGNNQSYIKWMQNTGQLQPKNQSNLTLLEQLGIPKHVRNGLVGTSGLQNEVIYLRSRLDSRQNDMDILKSLGDYLKGDLMSTRRTPIMKTNFDYFNNPRKNLPKYMLRHIKKLTYVDDRLFPDDSLIQLYRNYLHNEGFKSNALSDLDIKRIISESYRSLTEKQTGSLKGKLVFHGSDQMFDNFAYNRTGQNTLNMGGQGPGNYFSTHGATYGQGSKQPGSISNMQPFMITGIDRILPGRRINTLIGQWYTETHPSIQQLSKSGIQKVITNKIEPYYSLINNRKFEIQKAIRSTKDAPKTLYIGTDQPMGYFSQKPNLEFAYRHNSGIKSLFPHPTSYKTGGNRDWSNISLNDKVKLSLAERLGIPKGDRFNKFDPMQTTVRQSFREPLGQMENGVVTSKRFGNQIGVGTEHYVYEDALDPNYVLKILYRDPNSTLQGLSQTVNKSLSKNNIPFFENITYQGHLKGSNGELYPVFRQKKIDAKPVSESDWTNTYFPILQKKFKPLQFIPEEIDGPFRRNLPQSTKTTNYLNIGDLSPNNVFFINGKPKIIDPYVYKKGGSIHIKEKNKGKFTEYCNGKVTQECIDKAKKSGNKKLVKRAVFAENSRK